MHGLRASGVCLLLASIAALLVSNDVLWQSKLSASEDTDQPEESDIVFMLQAKEVVEFGMGGKKTIDHISADLAKGVTATRNHDVPAVSSILALKAEPEVMKTVGSDGGGAQSYLRLSFVSMEMWRTKAIRLWRSKVMALNHSVNNSGSVPLILLLLLFGCIGAACFMLAVNRFAGDRIEWRTSPQAKSPKVPPVKASNERADKAVRHARPEARAGLLSPSPSPSPYPSQILLPAEAHFAMPMNSLREANVNTEYDTEVMILNNTGDPCLAVVISNMIGGVRIQVSPPRNEDDSAVIVEPPSNTSRTNSMSLVIRGPSFSGRLERQSEGEYVVLEGKQPVMYLSVIPNTRQVIVTTDHGKLASLTCGGLSLDGEERLDVHVDANADALLVLACALSVVIRLFV